jgi:hypothetical protein
LVGFIDSYWADDPDDQNSTASYVSNLGLGHVTWACKKQHAISLYSTKLEYLAVVNEKSRSIVASKYPFRFWIPTTTYDHPLVRQSECHQAC